MEVRLKEVRGAFLQLFTAKQVNGEGEPAFSASLIMPKTSPNVKLVNSAIEAVAKEKWGEKAAGILKTLRASDRTCLHDGDTKQDYEGFPDNFFVTARSKGRPLVLNRDKTPLTEEDGKPYSGCYINAVIDVWAQDNKYGKRVNASLKGVQFVKDGDAFSASAPARLDDFEDLGEGADAGELA